MNEAEKILVVVLSTALAVFLILGIIASVYFIQFLKSLNRISAKAEEVGDAIEDSVKSLAGARVFASVMDLFSSKIRNKRRK